MQQKDQSLQERIAELTRLNENLARQAGAQAAAGTGTVTEGNQHFSSAFENAAIGMAVLALDSHRLRVNQAFCDMLGYSKDELLMPALFDVTHPEDMAEDLLQRGRALAGEIETYQREKRYLHKSGRIVWAHLTCSLVRGADGAPLHFISQMQDITERRRAEQILREGEERFRALVELSNDWFWEQDENFRFVQVSGEVADMASVTSAQSIGKLRWELDYVGMDDSVWAAHKALLERHEAFRDFEVTRLDSKGEVRYLSISGVPIFDASGRFTGYRGTGRDTTALRRSTDNLRASERLLHEITDTIPALIAYVDSEQRCRFHNRAYQDAFGLTSEQLLGKTMRELMGDEYYEKTLRSKVEEVLAGYPVVYERKQRVAHGGLRHFVVNYFPRYDDDDKVIGFYSLATDITELKRIDQLKNEFVSTVSHELRTPLTSIRGSLGLIAGGVAGKLPDAVQNLVGIAKSNCERLIRLINDILDIEKIESGKMKLELQPVALAPLVAQAVAANEGFALANGVRLVLHCEDEDIQVNVEPDRLTQVVTNLLSNALKFSPADGTVDVHVKRQGLGVRVEIRDHGPGIPQEFRGRIFQKFSQADSSDTRQKSGTGLGLNISRAIVERLGGTIGFETQSGEGTTFYFELPELKIPGKALPGEPPPRPRPRILICEGDVDVARLIGIMLDKAGFDTDMAHNAEQAFEFLTRGGFDAVTLDLKLPGQTGGAFLDALRNNEKTMSLPVVVISALTGQGELKLDQRPSAVSEWLPKPIDEDRLISSMQRAVSALKGRKPRILHVEDDVDIQHITAAIAADFASFEFAATLAQARDCLLSKPFDLVLLDLSLGKESGWDLVEVIDTLDPRPSLIVFSASDVLPGGGSRPDAVLLKASTSNVDLLHTIQRVLKMPEATEPPPTE